MGRFLRMYQQVSNRQVKEALLPRARVGNAPRWANPQQIAEILRQGGLKKVVAP